VFDADLRGVEPSRAAAIQLLPVTLATRIWMLEGAYGL
jgi:hypothetical protein